MMRYCDKSSRPLIDVSVKASPVTIAVSSPPPSIWLAVRSSSDEIGRPPSAIHQEQSAPPSINPRNRLSARPTPAGGALPPTPKQQRRSEERRVGVERVIRCG